MKKILLLTLALSVIISSAVIAAPAKGMPFWGVGMYQTTPTVRLNLTDSISSQIGVRYATPAGVTTYLVTGNMKISKIGQNNVVAGLAYWITPVTTASVLDLTIGIETMLNSNVSVGLLIEPLSFTSLGGTTTTVLSNAVLTATLYL